LRGRRARFEDVEFENDPLFFPFLTVSQVTNIDWKTHRECLENYKERAKEENKHQTTN